MGFIIFAILLGIPVLEIFVFIQASESLGLLNVILLTLGTAVLGTFIIRVQGFAALQEIRRNMGEQKPPIAPVMDGMFLLLAAPFLMTPGFVTDAVGFLLLVPPVRYAIARWALKKVKRSMDDGTVTIIRSP